LILKKLIKIVVIPLEMSYFRAEMHRIRFRLRIRPSPCWERSQHSSKYRPYNQFFFTVLDVW